MEDYRAELGLLGLKNLGSGPYKIFSFEIDLQSRGHLKVTVSVNRLFSENVLLKCLLH